MWSNVQAIMEMNKANTQPAPASVSISLQILSEGEAPFYTLSLLSGQYFLWK